MSMSKPVSLAQVLTEEEWNLEDIQEVLLKDHSCVNEELCYPNLDVGNKWKICPPLHFVIQSKNCSVDLMKLLIKFGANVNEVSKYNKDQTPLHLALSHARDISVIRVLIENGAIVDLPKPSLCAALGSGSSKDVIELLLNIGCARRTCKHEDHLHSVLHCASDRSLSGKSVSTDILQMLVNYGADTNLVNRKNESLLCYALKQNNDAHTIEWLIGLGVRCRQHVSPLFCLTERMDTNLNTSVVNLLLRSGATNLQLNSDGLLPLQGALLHCIYEKDAIKLLYRNIMDLNYVVDNQRNSLLHLAVRNKHCKFFILELLIAEGERMENRNIDGKTALEAILTSDSLTGGASDFYERKLKIIEVFLKWGYKVHHKTVLLAVEYCNDVRVVKSLIDASASVKQSFLCSLLKLATSQLSEHPRQIITVKYLMRYYFLKFSYYHMHFLDSKHAGKYNSLFRFKNNLVKELLRMKLEKVGRCYTVHDYLISSPAVKQRCDLDRLLNVIKAFPLYFELISEKADRSQIEKKLEEFKLGFMKQPQSNADTEVKVFFPYEVILNISKALNNKDLFSLLEIANLLSPLDKIKHKGIKRKVSASEDTESIKACKRCNFLLNGPVKKRLGNKKIV